MSSEKILNDVMQLLETISYGFVDINGELKFNTMEKINKTYTVSSPNEVLKNKVGSCFDKVELERHIFSKYFATESYAIIRFPLVHSFIVLQSEDKYIYFEQSSSKMKGICQFDSLETLLKSVVDKYIKIHNINKTNNLYLIKYNQLKPGMNVNNLMNIFNKSDNLLPYIFENKCLPQFNSNIKK